MFDSLPAALLALFLAACVLWLIWQTFRRLLSPRKRMLEPSPADEPGNGRIEPTISRSATAPSTIPDAADVLALKSAIDNLARQVAALEKRLASGQAGPPPQRSASNAASDQSPELPSVTPDHRIWPGIAGMPQWLDGEPRLRGSDAHVRGSPIDGRVAPITVLRWSERPSNVMTPETVPLVQ